MIEMDNVVTHSEINKIVKEFILQVARDQSLPVEKVEDHQDLAEDLGFASLDVATLVSLLEVKLEVDPFSNNQAVYTELRTVDDFCNLYEKCLSSETRSETTPVAGSVVQASLSRGRARRLTAERKKAKNP